MNDIVQLFKLELKALKLLEAKQNRLQEEYNRLNYILVNVRGVDPSKEPNAPGADIRLLLIEKKDELEAEIDLIGAQIERTYIKLERFSTLYRKILIEVYYEGNTIESVAQKLGYSESTLKRLINKKIYDVLN